MLSKLEKMESADVTSKDVSTVTKGFRVFVLPESVLKKVLNEMDLVDILELSLSSKKSGSIIHSCSIPVEMIQFDWNQISVFRNHYDRCDIKYDLIDCGNTEHRFIGGCRFDNWKIEESGVISCYPRVSYYRSALFNHLNTIFPVSRLFYTIDKWPVFQMPHELPRNAFSLTIPKVSNPELVEDTIETILDYFDVEDTLDIEYSLSRLTEKMLKVKNLKLESVLNIPLADFLHSNLKKLEIAKHDYKSGEIRDGVFHFLGNGFKYLQVEHRRRHSDFYQFLQGADSYHSTENNCLRFQKCSKRLSVSVGYNGSYMEFNLKKDKNAEKKKTPLPLFRLPALPLREIFSVMNPAETLEISLLSKRAKLSIKSLNIRLKRIVLNTDQLKLTDETDESREITMIDDDLNRDELKQNTFRSQMIGENKFFTFVKLQEDFTKTLCCLPMNSTEHFSAFTHFLSLYKVGAVKFDISNPPDNIFTNFQSIANLEISGRLRTLPREVCNISSLRITTRGNIQLADFLSLNCSSIQLLNHRLTNRQVNSWIRHWKQNETNIQSLSLENNNFNMDIILRGFTIRSWQTRNKANREEYRLSCAGEIWEIQRDFDGKKASVGLMGEFLELRVWKD